MPPALGSSIRSLRADMADPVLAILGGATLVVAVFAAVLGVATAQNEWDSLTYHLTRAAFWIQQGAVSYVPDVADVRINGNPPNAEIAQAWTMLLARGDRFVAIPSLAAVPALMLGIFGIARRAGSGAREALFGAFVFGCLPLVVLQSSTAMNDLVVASFFVIATYFAIGRTAASALSEQASLSGSPSGPRSPRRCCCRSTSSPCSRLDPGASSTSWSSSSWASVSAPRGTC